MKKAIQHLPQQTQDELNTLIELIVQNISDCQVVILFGSFARGNYTIWEETFVDGHFESYQSDYDILVVADRCVERAKIDQINDKYDAIFLNQPHRTHPQIIVENMEELNRQLNEGQYFYTDIITEGITLYDTPKANLAKSHNLSFQEIRDQASDYFDVFFNSACQLVESGKRDTNNDRCKTHAFILNQACKHFYKTICLVFSLRHPKEDNLEKLGAMVKRYSRELSTVFLRQTEFEIRCFDLLNQVDEESDNRHFVVTEEELDYMIERTQILKEITECICKDKITAYEALTK